MSRKLLLDDAHGPREFLLVGTLTVGRDPRCEISANDPLLSRQHAEFVETASGVLVRDLHSQNGIKVNDIAVKEAALQNGDIVRVAGMRLRFVEEANAQSAPSPGDRVDDKTEIIKGPPRLAQRPAPSAPDASAPAAAPQAPAWAAEPASSMPVTPVAPATPAPDTAPGLPPPARVAPSLKETVQGEDDDQRTRVVAKPQPAARQARPAAAPASAAPAAAPAAARTPAAAVSDPGRVSTVEPPSPAPVTTRPPRGSWAGRVLLRVLLLGLLCSLASAVPLMFWHQQQMNAVALSRATTLGSWFAAEASLALEKGNDAGPAIEALSGQAGIVAARVLSPQGHVIAPASRADEVVSGIPGLNAAPTDILHQTHAWNGDLLEVVQPVATSRGPNTALVWLTINPATEYGGSSLVIVAPAVVVAIFIAWIVAMLITRPTLRALAHLNEDVELALSGRLEAVTDPLGAKPVKELADAISYLAARIRTAGIDVALGPPGSRGPVAVGTGSVPASSRAAASEARHAGSMSSAASVSASVQAQAAMAAAQAAPPLVGGRMTADTAFRVIDADEACAALLGTRVEALVGNHLLDAITDRLVVDAVLGCLSALPPEGERQTTATDASGREIAVTVSRTGKDQPVTITLRAVEARQA